MGNIRRFRIAAQSRHARRRDAGLATPGRCGRYRPADPRRPVPDRAASHLAFRRKQQMAEPIYKVVEIVGASEESISKAIENGIAKAAETLRHLDWFEVTQMRGSLANGKVHRYQVTLKVGFTLE
jgi:hypothetical protein